MGGWGPHYPSAPPYAVGTCCWNARPGATCPAASTFLGVEFIKQQKETLPVSSGTESIRHLKEDKGSKLFDISFSNIYSRYISPQARETKLRINNVTVSY